MSNLIIRVTGTNHAILDGGITKLLNALPADARIEVRPRTAEGAQVRQVSVSADDDKLVARLARLDLPASLELRVQVLD